MSSTDMLPTSHIDVPQPHNTIIPKIWGQELIYQSIGYLFKERD